MYRLRGLARFAPILLSLLLLVYAGVQAQAVAPTVLYIPLIHADLSTPTPTQHPLPHASPTTIVPIPDLPTTTPTATPSATATSTNATIRGDLRLRPLESRYGAAPQRYVFILDVSGSQNANFAGQGWKNGQAVQCTSGPVGSPPLQNCSTPANAWPVVNERRIYAQKQAALSFIDHLNLPENAGYDPTRPSDQVMILAYNERLVFQFPTSFSAAEVSDAAVLQAAILEAGLVQSNPYLTEGGTHWTVGLYAAAHYLAAAAPTSTLEGVEYRYDQRVIFITDGITNHFFREELPTQSVGYSNHISQPAPMILLRNCSTRGRMRSCATISSG